MASPQEMHGEERERATGSDRQADRAAGLGMSRMAWACQVLHGFKFLICALDRYEFTTQYLHFYAIQYAPVKRSTAQIDPCPHTRPTINSRKSYHLSQQISRD